MGNSKQKIIEKLNCIPDDLSEEEIIERLYRMMRLEHSKQRCEKGKSMLELYSLLGQGYKAMQEGRESSINEVKERIYFNE